jgi:hypothetical protein
VRHDDPNLTKALQPSISIDGAESPTEPAESDDEDDKSDQEINEIAMDDEPDE